MTKLNLGSGNHIIEEEGWINMDKFVITDSPYFKEGSILDIPLESNSVDYILCDQVLEHLRMADVPIALFNIRRVLKEGGKATIVVPDFEDAVKQWLSADHNGAFNPLTYQYYSEVIYGNQNHDGEYHKTPMCAGYLHAVLNMVGLNNHEIVFYPAFGKIPDLEGGRPYPEKATLRNAQLLVNITK